MPKHSAKYPRIFSPAAKNGMTVYSQHAHMSRSIDSLFLTKKDGFRACIKLDLCKKNKF